MRAGGGWRHRTWRSGTRRRRRRPTTRAACIRRTRCRSSELAREIEDGLYLGGEGAHGLWIGSGGVGAEGVHVLAHDGVHLGLLVVPGGGVGDVGRLVHDAADAVLHVAREV